jgi:hypothetical protein
LKLPSFDCRHPEEELHKALHRDKAKVAIVLLFDAFLGLHKGNEWNNRISIEFPFFSFGKFGTCLA